MRTKEGCAGADADIVVFDFDDLTARATFSARTARRAYGIGGQRPPLISWRAGVDGEARPPVRRPIPGADRAVPILLVTASSAGKTRS